MYFIGTVAVLLLVFILPGLALRPKLALQPETALAIPFVSVLVVLLLQFTLSFTGIYQPLSVQALSLALALVAVWRLYRTWLTQSHQAAWRSYEVQVFLIAVALCIYFSPMLLVYGFDKDDEIYSWNMWAIQHFLGESVDLSYTRAPYPQLFPRLLSYAYMLLGGIEFQTAVKTSLIIFPFIFFSLLGLASSRNRYFYLVLYVLLSLFLLREVDMKHIFDDGMPDTMMAVGVVLSVYFFLLYQSSAHRVDYLWLSVICSIVATLSKQPALVWSMASMPLLIIFGHIRQRLPVQDIFVALIPALVGAIWMLTEGRNFEDNSGVTGRSFADRGYIEQLAFAVRAHFFDDWKLAALYLLGVVSCFRNRAQLGVLCLFALPSTATWLLFASYDLRAGVPAILTMGLFIAHGGYMIAPTSARERSIALKPVIACSASALLVALAFSDAVSSVEKHRKKVDLGFEPGLPLRNNFTRMFPNDADKIYEQIINNDEARIWTPTHYVFGLLYGYTDVIRPGHRNSSYNAQELLEELRSSNRNFATNSGEVPAGPAGAILDELAIRQCPEMFKRFSGPGNMYGLVIYQLNTDLLHSDYCEPDSI